MLFNYFPYYGWTGENKSLSPSWRSCLLWPPWTVFSFFSVFFFPISLAIPFQYLMSSSALIYSSIPVFLLVFSYKSLFNDHPPPLPWFHELIPQICLWQRVGKWTPNLHPESWPPCWPPNQYSYQSPPVSRYHKKGLQAPQVRDPLINVGTEQEMGNWLLKKWLNFPWLFSGIARLWIRVEGKV